MGNDPYPDIRMDLSDLQPPPIYPDLHLDDERMMLMSELEEERQRSLTLASDLEFYLGENIYLHQQLEALENSSADEISQLHHELERIQGASSSSLTSNMELQSLKQTLAKNAEEILKLQLELARIQGQLMVSERMSHHLLSNSQCHQSGSYPVGQCPYSAPMPPSIFPTTSTTGFINKQGRSSLEKTDIVGGKHEFMAQQPSPSIQ